MPADQPGIIVAEDPPIEIVEDVLYRPVSSYVLIEDPSWGIYARSGALVESTAHLRGPGKDLIGASWNLPWPASPVAAASSKTYLYGGSFIAHYGHFLLSSVGRFWPFAVPALRASLENLPILVHAAQGLDYWFGLSFVAELFEGLGLARERFVTFDAPTLIPRLVVPGPSLIEMKRIHPAYARLARQIGSRLSPRVPAPNGRPVWFSRTQVKPASQGFENEGELEAVLAAFGVDIAYPEQLSIAQKLQLFAERRVIAGTVSSVFHTAAFCPTRPATSIALNPSLKVNANYLMIDRVAGLDARYRHIEAEDYGIDLRRRLWRMFRLRDPRGTAAAVLAMIQAVSREARH